MSDAPFVHLRVRSPYSLLEGAIRIKETAALCKTFSMPAAALTDSNNLFGALAARWRGIPFVPNVTGLGTVFLGSRALFEIGRALYRVSLGKSPVVFVQNEDDREFHGRLDVAVCEVPDPQSQE